MKTLKFAIILMIVLSAVAGAAFAAPMRIGSITTGIDVPMGVASDSLGNIYVSEPARNTVMKFNSQGQFVSSFSVPRPQGIAVDAAGNIYVCSANYREMDNKNAVYIYNAGFTKIGALGIGEGEFGKPMYIEIDAGGTIFVTDKYQHVVKVYNAQWAKIATIGGFAKNTNGKFNKPSGLALNDAAGEVYVADLPDYTDGNGTTMGARIQVFDKSGVFLRAFGKFGTNVGQITSPGDIAVDAAGHLYVTDSYQHVVHVLNSSDGTPVGEGGLYSSYSYQPSGVVITRNGLAYVAVQKTEGKHGRLDVYGLDGYVTMDVTPLNLIFAAKQFSGNPAAQTVVIANSGSGGLTWSATADQPWIKLGSQEPVGPKSSVGLLVGVDIANLNIGAYEGTVTITSSFGQSVSVRVTLSVTPPPILSISNGWLNFSVKKGSASASQPVTIGIIDGSGTWSAMSDSAWLSITPASGGAASTSSQVTVNPTGLGIGSYTGYITISAPGVIGDGSKITVNLNVAMSSRIRVTTNQQDASFTISGPATYNGSGTDWSVEGAPAGEYTVTFASVSGFRKPLSQTKALPDGGEVVFSGTYVSWKDLAARKTMVAAKNSGDGLVKAYRNNGEDTKFDLMTFDASGANVAVGDIDGDGIAELIVSAAAGNPASVRTYKTDKTLLLEMQISTADGTRVAAADLNGDGISEVLISKANVNGDCTVTAYEYAGATMVQTGIELTTACTSGGPSFAAVDTEGDGKPEIVTAPGAGKKAASELEIWKTNVSGKIGEWTATSMNKISLIGSFGTTVAGADIDGDGKDEIIAATGGSMVDSSKIRILKTDGTQVSMFKAFDKYSANIAAADLDGDGKAEIIAAAGIGVAEQEDNSSAKNAKTGKHHDNETHGGDNERGKIRVYSASGKIMFMLRPFGAMQYGVNPAVGDLGL